LIGIVPSSLCRRNDLRYLSFGGNLLQCYPFCLRSSSLYYLGVGSTPICDLPDGVSFNISTTAPTVVPTSSPSTAAPTVVPSCSPSTAAPAVLPTRRPTRAPTRRPTRRPTRTPTRRPTRTPTLTVAPTVVPTHSPSSPAPTPSPST